MNKILSATFLAYVLLACGGGSGGSAEPENTALPPPPPPPPTNTIPVVNIGEDLTSNELEVVFLEATATDADGDALSYKWTRISGSYSHLLDDDTLSTSIQLHNLKEVSVEEYQLTVTDSNGASASDSIAITVNPVNTSPTYTMEGKLEYEEYNLVSISVVFADPDIDGRIEETSVEQLEGPEVVAEFEQIQGTINIVFDAPEVSNETTFKFLTQATDDEGGETEAIVEFIVDNRPAIIFTEAIAINDTGITLCSDGFDDNLECPVATLPGQDAEHGRDKLASEGELLKTGSGKAGFDFTKLDSNGQPLDPSAQEWACVLDNHTGLIWEVKLDEPNDIRHKFNTFYWYNPYQDLNGGVEGTENRGDCSEVCNTHEYQKAINDLAICGINKWTLPSVMQLRSIVDYSILYPGPVVDENFFPNADLGDQQYIGSWTHETNYFTTTAAWGVRFDTGSKAAANKIASRYIRLVAQNN